MGRTHLRGLMRVASLDIGTNTVLLLIADIDGDNLKVVTDDHTIARLGEGVDRTGVISDAAYDRLRVELTRHKQTIDRFAPDTVMAVATSAMRDAANRDEVLRRAKADTGIDIEIISGDEEARWTFIGSIQALSLPTSERIGVVDIGGGSTELAVGTQREYQRGNSMQIGAVRLSERARAENMTLDAARSMVRATFEHTAPDVSTLIAVAGTPTSLASMDLELRAFDAQKIHGYGLPRASVDRLLTDIWPLTSDQIVMRYPSVSRGRADILAAGTVILSEAMKFVRVDQCTVSTRGLRYGIAMRAAVMR